MRVFCWLRPILLGLLLPACSPDSARQQPGAATTPAAPLPPPTPAPSTSSGPPTEVYIGTIGTYPVVLGLRRTGAELSGSYYYLRQVDTYLYQDLRLGGAQRGDSLRLVEFDAEGRQTHAFRGVLAADSTWRGQWQPFGRGRALPFALRRQPRPDYERYLAAWKQALTGPAAHDGWRLDTVSWHVQEDTTGVGPLDPERPAGLPDPLCHYRILLQYPRLRGGPAPLRARLNALLGAEARRHFEGQAYVTQIRPATARDTGQYCRFDATEVRYLNRELLSFDALSTDETPHGDEQHYWRHGTLRLPELRPFRLTELLRGDFRAVFRRYVQQAVARTLGPDRPPSYDPDSHCRASYLLRQLLAEVDTLRTTATVLVRPEGLQILTYDPRDVGCPQVQRGPYELIIPYLDLQPYLRPDGPLARVAAGQAARLRRVEAPFRAAGR